jgi:translation initiation factor 3 subunit A
LKQIDADDNQEDFYFNSIDPTFDERQLNVTKNWNLLLEAYKTELDLIYKNSKLEEMYCDIANRALSKCVEYGRKDEFLRFSEYLKTHLSHNIRTQEKNTG